MTIYDRIKWLCDRNGVAVTVLEQRIGFSRGSIGKMKKGGKTSPERLQKIADFFGVSVSYLIGEPDGAAVSPEAEKIENAIVNKNIYDLLNEAESLNDDDIKLLISFAKRLNRQA